MRVAVVDIGTNSTRLLIADVEDAAVVELDRRTAVTRLGDHVDATGRLDTDAMQRVFAVLREYREAIDAMPCDATTAVLTSAVRDASNGAEFAAQVKERYGLEAHTLDGEQEARLTFLGATAGRDWAGADSVLVLDIGGGSTEFIIGDADGVSFHVSLQAGVVRHTERHLHGDPPEPRELQELAVEIRTLIAHGVPAQARTRAAAAIAVAGTPTSLAAIDLGLDPYDPAKVQGHRLTLIACERLLERLAALELDERRRVTGLHPDRAPTIVAGTIILIEALRAFGLKAAEVSEHDILWGAALQAAGVPI